MLKMKRCGFRYIFWRAGAEHSNTKTNLMLHASPFPRLISVVDKKLLKATDGILYDFQPAVLFSTVLALELKVVICGQDHSSPVSDYQGLMHDQASNAIGASSSQSLVGNAG
jgi:hypothetical protein